MSKRIVIALGGNALGITSDMIVDSIHKYD